MLALVKCTRIYWLSWCGTEVCKQTFINYNCLRRTSFIILIRVFRVVILMRHLADMSHRHGHKEHARHGIQARPCEGRPRNGWQHQLSPWLDLHLPFILKFSTNMKFPIPFWRKELCSFVSNVTCSPQKLVYHSPVSPRHIKAKCPLFKYGLWAKSHCNLKKPGPSWSPPPHLPAGIKVACFPEGKIDSAYSDICRPHRSCNWLGLHYCAHTVDLKGGIFHLPCSTFVPTQ